ncbi:MAG: calcium-binding protein [Planctomycetota bacterium]|nr:calcium-binding protein [Planctomycetota bacterium]
MLKKSAIPMIGLVLALAGGCGSNSSSSNNTVASGTQTFFFPITGTNGNDVLNGSPNGEQLNGMDGNDILNGNGGDDFLIGGNGDDVLNGGDGDDALTGGPGADVLNGGAGNDTAGYAGSANSVAVNLNLATAQSGGDAEGDLLTSIENVFGSSGDDTITGNAGDNIIRGGPGADTLNGGTGTDTLDYNGSGGAVTVNLVNNTASGGDAEGDSISNFENVRGGSGNDNITGSSAIASIMEGGPGADTITGNANVGGFASYENSGAGVTVNLSPSSPMTSGGDAEGDTLVAPIQGLIGSSFGDILTGSELFNCVIDGGDGDDVIQGDLGADVILGGNGNDLITGGAGDDQIFGGPGNDTINGGFGDDIIDFQPGDSIDFGTPDFGFETLIVSVDAVLDANTNVVGGNCLRVPDVAGPAITIDISPDFVSNAFVNREVFVDDPTFFGDSSATLTGTGWTSQGTINMFGLTYLLFVGQDAAGNACFLNVNIAITGTAGIVP